MLHLRSKKLTVLRWISEYSWMIVLLLSASSGVGLWIWQATIHAIPEYSKNGHHSVILEAFAIVSPEALSPWQETIQLPFKWDAFHPKHNGKALFNISLPAVDPSHPHALYLPRVGNQATVRDSEGNVLAHWGDLNDPSFDSTRLPRIVYLNRTALEAGKLVIEISAQSARSGGLGVIQFGPTSEIRKTFDWLYKWRVYGSLVIVANLFLLAVFSLGVWWFRRDPLAVDLGFGSLFGAFVYWTRTLELPPVPWPWWGICVSVAILAHILFFWRVWVLVFDAKSAWSQPKLFFGAMLSGILLTTTAFLVGLPQLWTMVLFATLVFGVSTAMFALRKLRLEKKSINLTQLLLHLIILLLLQWDVIVGRIYGDGVGTPQLAPVATLLVIGLFALFLIQRFNAYPPQIHIAANALGRGRLMERERIMRDLHDGLGGNLVALKQMLGRESISRTQIMEEMDLVMDEMRITIDSLQPSNNDLSTILATLRYRLQPRMDAAGIRVVWRLPKLHSELIQPPEQIFHLQKILMEALTNVQKHSSAKNVWIQLEVPSSAVHGGFAIISIEDDGSGISTHRAPSAGIGLENMAARASAIGAELFVGNGLRGGTLVQLRVPLRPDKSP